MTADPAQPLIGFGHVRHTRLRPRRHAFAYRTFFLMLPMRTLRSAATALAVNRRGAISFHDVDHGDGRGEREGGALGWIEGFLREQGVEDASGEIWLHCYPRVFGYTFKPVSFWYCHSEDGCLRAIVVEVNNTFGERHCYLLDSPRYGAEFQVAKAFRVSPFCDVSGGYRFRFMRSGASHQQRTVARIDHFDASGPLLETSVSGQLVPVTTATLRRALWRYPAMTLAIIGRIHWQALRLWWMGVPLQSPSRSDSANLQAATPPRLP